MIDYSMIYRNQGDDYDRLVSREDYQGNILAAIRAIRSLEDLNVIDLGAGTGRMTRLLAPEVRGVVTLDLSFHMLRVASTSLGNQLSNLKGLVQADNRALPLQDRTFDMAVAGWSLGHLTSWSRDSWQAETLLTRNPLRNLRKVV